MFKGKDKRFKKWLSGGSRKQKTTRKRRNVRVVSFIFGAILFCVVTGLFFAFGVLAFFSRDLPSPDRLSEREIPQSTKLYSQDDVLLYEIFEEERRTLVKLEDIPEDLQQATIAVEDADFYKHGGFDVFGIVRSAFRIARGEALQSGSTITQQVVKNTLLTSERTITRKIKELILAIQLERKYTKDEILQIYFNEVPYGGQAWGVGAAAEMYYGKSISDLTLAESTYIAGLPQAPSFYSPCGAYPESAKERQKVVLNLMEDNGFITAEEKEEVLATEIEVVCRGYSREDIKAPHFVMYVKSVLTEMFGEKLVKQGGLKVTTTLDYGKQLHAEDEVRKQLAALAAANANATNAGVISVSPDTGEILAMVGSADYFDTENDGNVNVILSERQPGSSIKPLTYLTGFRMGYSPSTYVSDIRTCFPNGAGQPDYCPINWDEKFWGPMSVRTALSNSRNIPAVKMLQVVGMQNMIDLAHELGITTLNEPERYGLALTLGGGEVRPLDMAQVFATFAALGRRTDLTPILKVEDPEGKVLYDHRPTSKQVIEPEYVYLLNDVLSDPVARRSTFGNSLEIGRTLATKTGTTNDNKDAWTIGYTPELVSVVWVGNFNNDPMNGIMGSTGATPIMKGYMTRALTGAPDLDWQRPENVVAVEVDSVSGLIPQDSLNLPTKTEIFVKGSVPKQVDDFHIGVDVCEQDRNKLATDYHKDNGMAVRRVFTYLKELSEQWQPYTNTWMESRREDGYGKPPEENCPIRIDGEKVDGPVIQVTTPQEGAKITKDTFEVTANIYSQHRITKVEFYWDDDVVHTTNSPPYGVQYDLSGLSDTDNGEHTVTVTASDSDGNKNSASVKVTLDRENEKNNDKDKNATPTPTDSEGNGSGTNLDLNIRGQFRDLREDR